MKEPMSFIDKMRHAGFCAARVLEYIGSFVKPGVTTAELDTLCHDFIVKNGGYPACLGYAGYPKSVCISINEIVCHGIPDQTRLKNGDIVNIDVTVLIHGVHGDTSKMFFVGEVKPWLLRLCRVTQEALYQAIEVVKPGVRLGRIGEVIGAIAQRHHYSVVQEFAGHFIGEIFHAPPDVLHYPADDHGFILEPDMTLTIEPMLNLGRRHIKILSDGWAVRTKDRLPSAQYEHTIRVTERGYEILTYREEETFPRCSL